MKILSAVFTMIFLLSSVVSFADDDTSSPPSQGMGHGRHGGKHANPSGSPSPSGQNKILGQCTVIAGNGNLIAGPCTNIVVTLEGGDGKETLYTRTSTNGTFEFNTAAGVKYKINVSSRFYEVVTPIENIQSGQKISLQLRQK